MMQSNLEKGVNLFMFHSAILNLCSLLQSSWAQIKSNPLFQNIWKEADNHLFQYLSIKKEKKKINHNLY